MEVLLLTHACDERTASLPQTLLPVFEALGKELKGDYGGTMEHLWIGLELIERDPSAVGPRYPFRFQKRVSGSSKFGLPRLPDKFNVGHFSVRPDFTRLTSLRGKRAIAYSLSLMYEGTAVLDEKSKRLGGFDAEKFRLRFRQACRELGHRCEARP